MRRVKLILLLLVVLLLTSCNSLKNNDNYIENIYYNDDILIVVYSDGSYREAGSYEIITNIKLVNGELLVEYGFSKNVNLGKVIGSNGKKGKDGKNITFKTTSTHLQWKYNDESTFNNLIDISLLKGEKGDDGINGLDASDVEFMLDGDILKWKYVDNTVWNDLIDVKDLVYSDGVIEYSITDSLFLVDNYLENIYEELIKQTVTVELTHNISSNMSTTYRGSGVLVYEDSEDVYIYTNQHVLTDNDPSYFNLLEVVFYNGYRSEFSVVASSKNEDIAIIKTKKNDYYNLATIGNSDLLSKGEVVMALGTPRSINHANTFTVGRVINPIIPLNKHSNNLFKEDEYAQVLIQSNASINKGNSGGPLFNINGELVGINTLKVHTNDEVIVGFNVSIPINYFNKVIDELISNGVYNKPTFNLEVVDIANLSYSERSNRGLLNKTGILVNSVSSSSSNFNIIKPNDIILSIDDDEVVDFATYKLAIDKLSIGDSVSVKVLRDNSIITISLTVRKLGG